MKMESIPDSTQCLSVTKILAKAGLFHRAAELIHRDQLAGDFLIVRTAQLLRSRGEGAIILVPTLRVGTREYYYTW